MGNRTLIINNEKVHQKIERIAYEILENFYEEKEIILIGISSRGYKIAEMVFAKLQQIAKQPVELLSISINKDDVYDENSIKLSKDLNTLNEKAVVVIDDVLNSGITLMYAVRYLLNARIKKMSTAVLVDRMHRNYPIRADFAGLTLSTTLQEHISVEFDELEVSVYLD
ncbi:MAG: phosphoribosyltransferase [Flavobacteriales bacterium]|nr:phosphoribosyltransferase [Flavobacteriales bacterium]MCB9197381.1 phosphoribosyltransferase [Flavobacteriales bacterium]